MSSHDAVDVMPSGQKLLSRYQELRSYVGLTDSDIEKALSVWTVVQPRVPDHVDDFYREILRHKATAAVFTGGDAQVERLKSTLRQWIVDLFHGTYDETFVRNRWVVGWRHVKIGLPHVWTAAGMCRLRDQMLNQLARDWQTDTATFQQASSAITRLMDLDLALIQDAYYAESVAEKLRRERDYAEAIIRTTESIVLLVDADCNILRSNTYVAQLVSGQDELPDGFDTVQAIISEAATDELKNMLEGETEGQAVGPVVATMMDVSSRPRTVRWFCRTLSDSVDHPPGPTSALRLLVGHDITDLSDAQRRVVQQERLAAIGQTMTGLAHESRNAFQRSQASLETLALEVNDNAEAVELIARIQRAHDHLLHQYEEVLQFAKPVLLELEPHRITDLLTRTWAHITQAGGYAANRVRILKDDATNSITCDAFAVEQILRNLMENALTVSPDDETIDIAIRADWQGKKPAVRVEVRDKGPGIPPEHFEKIFEPFFSTRSRGTGLGLPIARRLAEAHGGSLELESSERGTVARLVLPFDSKGDTTTDPENRPDYRRA